jgi:hypothetical protein
MAQESDSSQGEAGPMALLSLGETAMGLQKELLQAYQRLWRIWLERLQVEVALWTRLARDLGSSKSDTDVMKAYSDHMARHLRMTAEDGRHIFSDYQEIARKIARTDGEDAHAIHDPEPEADEDLDLNGRVTH